MALSFKNLKEEYKIEPQNYWHQFEYNIIIIEKRSELKNMNCFY